MNCLPHKCVLFAQSTKIGKHDNKAIHSNWHAHLDDSTPCWNIMCLWNTDHARSAWVWLGSFEGFNSFYVPLTIFLSYHYLEAGDIQSLKSKWRDPRGLALQAKVLTTPPLSIWCPKWHVRWSPRAYMSLELNFLLSQPQVHSLQSHFALVLWPWQLMHKQR